MKRTRWLLTVGCFLLASCSTAPATLLAPTATVIVASATVLPTLAPTLTPTALPTTPTVEERAAEEYAIYQIIIANADYRADLRFAILDVTRFEPLGDIHLQEWLAIVPEPVQEDYRAMNRGRPSLPYLADLEGQYGLIQQADLDEIFSHGIEGWAVFAEKYPDFFGYLALSRVGFNAELNQALVYMESNCGITCGQGNLYFLVKTNGAWEINKIIPLWIS